MISTKTLDTVKFFTDSLKKSTITNERKELLFSIAAKIAEEYLDREKINLNFICTHNSRRSQFTQIWAFFAAEYYELENIHAYSGGTAVTAFHKNTVKALQQSGFNFNIIDFSHQNPKYLISFSKTKKHSLGFSKLFDDANNPYPYIAITTCNSADENCPFIPDAIDRFHLPYVDPKVSDNTASQTDKYLETSQEIATEIGFLFSEIKRIIEAAN
ncbi:hypothetical protein PL373_02050 [Tenacibaculum maritimum]|nr:hypothetical protein [Tenacibaculum maritimum]MDB0599956.1 hypothetical protein [Tenacibaculum maritimum]MDB0611102.1 hypothetical protein [Tenacibaculum maritimum]